MFSARCGGTCVIHCDGPGTGETTAIDDPKSDLGYITSLRAALVA